MRAPNKALSIFIIVAVALSLAAALFVFSEMGKIDRQAPSDHSNLSAPALTFRIVSFADLPGWREDDQAAALNAFKRSCAAMTDSPPTDPANHHEMLGGALKDVSISGVLDDWRRPCTAAEDLSLASGGEAGRDLLIKEAREFFEFHFVPIQMVTERKALPGKFLFRPANSVEQKGLFTGYFEPVYEASRLRTPVFSAPARRRPDDLVSVDLRLFRDDLAGERIAGKVVNGVLAPYPDRAGINSGALDDSVAPIAWLTPNDLFFLQIQGSGVLRFRDGATQRIGYDGQNGRQYTAIGRVLVERGVMAREDVSMRSIREWLEQAATQEAQSLREENQSYVFFRELSDGLSPELGPLGAQQVQLTPERSIAVDRRFHAMGAPLWIDLDPSDGNIPALRKLMIAQDTGGAIKGPLRGDIFWGAGDKAGEIAGAMRAEGRLYVLVPTAVAARLPHELMQ